MNLLYIPSWFPSRKKPSNGIYFYEQAKALSKICDNVFIIYPREIELKKNIFKNEENIYFYSFPKIHYKKTFFFYLFLKYYIKKIIKKFGKINIINAQSFLWAGIESSKIAKKFNIPLIITEHHSRYLVGKENKKITNLIRLSIKYSAKIVFVSSSLKNSFSKKIIGNKSEFTSKFLVIHNSISDNFFNILYNEKVNFSEEKITYILNHQKSSFIFSSIGNLKKEKGFDTLIQAFNKAFNNNENNLNIKLFIGGDGPERKKIENLIEKLNLKEKIILLGHLSRNQVEYFLEKSNCFVLASRYETFGIVYIEALAKGLPVIATNCGGPKDIINDDCGILTEIDDIEGLKNAMIYMYKNYDKYDKEKIKQYAFDNFSDTAFIKKYKNLYDEILKSFNPQRQQ